MLLNHNRQTVHDAIASPAESLCPDCLSDLIARRGDVVVWHWAHKPDANRKTGCVHEETQWHLLMKAAYLHFANWEVEVPIGIAGPANDNGSGYYLHCRLDAANRVTGAIREFVHSLSPTYWEKHTALKDSGLDVLWILDGSIFVSAHAKPIKKGGLKNLLKPRALELHRHIRSLVHHDGKLWHEWKETNIWYPNTGERSLDIVRLYNEEKSVNHGMM